jgi:hypothetical protein
MCVDSVILVAGYVPISHLNCCEPQTLRIHGKDQCLSPIMRSLDAQVRLESIIHGL